MRRFLLVIAFVTLNGAIAFGQSLEDEVRAMRAEMARMRSELDAVKEQLRQAVPAAPSEDPPLPGAPAPQPTLGNTLALMQTQIAQQARSKVESNTGSSVKFFGTIVSNTMLNTGEPNWLDIGNVVTPRPAGIPTGSFTTSLRQTRLGAIIDGPNIGTARTSAVVAMDFFGGMPNFQTGQAMGLPRLLYAYARVQGAKTAFMVGQDEVILAPKNPTSLAGMAFPILFRAGNLYLRAPQVRAERDIVSGAFGNIRVVGGIVAPIGGDASTAGYLFVPPNLAGERSRRPAVQARVSWSAKPAGPYEVPQWEFAVSGHVSRERYAAGLSESQAWSADFDFNKGFFGIGGELFTGRNIDAFGASLAQNAKSRGGFAEVRFAATPQWDFNGGAGTDQLFSPLGTATLVRNTSYFANTIHRFIPEFAASLEYRRLQTYPRTGLPRRNDHFNLTLAYSF